MSKLNFVSCVAWVRKGVAKEVPNRVKMSVEGIQLKIEQNEQLLKQLNIDTENSFKVEVMQTEEEQTEEDKEIADRYNLADYDTEERVNDGELNHSELLVFADNEQDPYLNNEETFSDDEDENDDFRIKPTDNLLLCGHIEEDCVSLEVKIFNQVDDIYVHHEIYLPAFPLCFQWLDYSSGGGKGNYLATGDMQTDINVWDLDTVDALDPTFTLTGHNDSTLDLAWHISNRATLASVSADKTCRIWDLEKRKTIQKFGYKCSVQSACFHPLESHMLLTGDCSGQACVFDCKSGSVKKWKVCQEDIEKVQWNPFNPYTFLCASETGTVYNMDCRNESSHLYVLKAHSKTISGLEFCSFYKGCLLTASGDQTIKIWDIQADKAHFIKELTPNVGTILCLSLNPDSPYLAAVSGDNIAQNVNVFDISTYKAVQEHFHQ